MFQSRGVDPDLRNPVLELKGDRLTADAVQRERIETETSAVPQRKGNSNHSCLHEHDCAALFEKRRPVGAEDHSFRVGHRIEEEHHPGTFRKCFAINACDADRRRNRRRMHRQQSELFGLCSGGKRNAFGTRSHDLQHLLPGTQFDFLRITLIDSQGGIGSVPAAEDSFPTHLSDNLIQRIILQSLSFTGPFVGGKGTGRRSRKRQIRPVHLRKKRSRREIGSETTEQRQFRHSKSPSSIARHERIWDQQIHPVRRLLHISPLEELHHQKLIDPHRRNRPCLKVADVPRRNIRRHRRNMRDNRGKSL